VKISNKYNFHRYLIVQIVFFVTFVSIATITYLSSYISHQQADSVSRQLKNQAIVLAKNIAATTSSYVITRDYTSIEEILLRAGQFESISSIQIVDSNGKTLSNVTKSTDGSIAPVFKAVKFNIPDGNELKINQFSDKIEIIAPVVLGDVVGWVRVIYSLDRIKQEKINIWVSNLTIGFAITILTVTILIFLLRKPVVSLKKYTEFADKLNEYSGEETHVDEDSVEMARLGGALNRASINLYEHHSKLQSMLSDMERIAAIAEHSPDIIVSIGIGNSVEYLNVAAKNAIDNFVPPDDKYNIMKILPANIDQVYERCISGNITVSNIESHVGDRIYLWKFTPFVSQSVLHCHAIDITEKKAAEERIVYQSNYDALTNLPNRTLVLDRLKQSISRSKRTKTHVGVLLLSVDRIALVNDTMGHNSGDRIIIEIAERMGACIRDADTLARFSDDTFLIILNDLRRALDAKVVAEKTIAAMSKEFDMERHRFHLGVSIGIAGCPDDENDENMLIRFADMALHKARKRGGNVYQFYTPEYNEQALVRVETEAELRHALENQELFLTYQPQIDISSNTIIGAEALIRWVNGKFGFVPPDRFIPMAEDTGLIVSIGEWVLRTACAEAINWQETFGLPLRVAVNVSARQFSGEDFPATVKKILDETGLSPSSLELEMTESLLAENSCDVKAVLERLKEIGVTLALDDFGTGYSSLSYLKTFPFDILKIDRAFIQDVIDDPDDASLCKAIVAIAESLELKVLGEGVETAEQLDFLRNIGTNMVQGYFYSKPLEIAQFIEYVNTFRQ